MSEEPTAETKLYINEQTEKTRSEMREQIDKIREEIREQSEKARNQAIGILSFVALILTIISFFNVNQTIKTTFDKTNIAKFEKEAKEKLESIRKDKKNFDKIVSDIEKNREISDKLVSEANKSFPIGTIIAWHKSALEHHDLPTGWIECNGQEIRDTESPFNNTAIPNLNWADRNGDGKPDGPGTGRYLRGTTGKTGDPQNATQHPYIWPIGVNKESKYPILYFPRFSIKPSDTDHVESAEGTEDMIKDKELNRAAHVTASRQLSVSGGHREKYYTSRPDSITVVWIIRIK